jgi:aminoglycoside 3-N-acetyltransferase
MNFVGLGPRAAWIVSPHGFDNATGPGTPLARLVEAGGQVLMLGAPLGTLTLLHHAEALADVPVKRRVTYRMPVPRDGKPIWVEFNDLDTSQGAFPYRDIVGKEEEFEVIAKQAMAAACGVTGRIGDATSYLFEADRLVAFAVDWLESHFG